MVRFMSPYSQPLKLKPETLVADPVPAQAEIRKDYYEERYVLLSAKRGQRPRDFKEEDPGLDHRHNASDCQDMMEPIVWDLPDGQGGWLVRAVKNKYPSLTLSNPHAFGEQEVLLDTPEHNVEFNELPVAQIEAVLEGYVQRTKVLAAIPGIKYVSVFRNNGHKAGASRAHLHSQISALPMIPPAVAQEAAAYADYHAKHDRCPVCDIIDWEIQHKARIIYEDKNLVIIAPFASKKRFEAWLIPRRHFASLIDAQLAERTSLATSLKNLTSRLNNSQIDYNYYLQEPALGLDHHFMLRLEPVPKTPRAGFEFSTGMIINAVFPEYAALWYQGKA